MAAVIEVFQESGQPSCHILSTFVKTVSPQNKSIIPMQVYGHKQIKKQMKKKNNNNNKQVQVVYLKKVL